MNYRSHTREPIQSELDSPYKGAFLLRHFAHTKGKNLINRVHLIDQHASHCMGEMSESDFGFENSDSKIRNLSPYKGSAGSTICQLNTSGSKIPHLSPYKGAFLLRHFAHTKGKNLINRVELDRSVCCSNIPGAIINVLAANCNF